MDPDGNRRRSSCRAIKRPKFDDELVESSLGSQNSIPLNKMRTRNPSLSTASECSVSLPSAPVSAPEARSKRVPTKSTKKSKKNKKCQSVIKNLGRWKPTDDLALIIGVQQTCDLQLVHKGTKFSCRFSFTELQERWYALLYDMTMSRVAQQAMKNLHPDQIQEVQANALYSKAEEELLGTISSISHPTLQQFECLLKDNPSVFYPSRTGKSLFTHWQLLKQYELLPYQMPALLPKGVPKDFADAEAQFGEKLIINSQNRPQKDQVDVNALVTKDELNEPKDQLLEHELNLCERGIKKEIKKCEEEVSRWSVVVDNVMGIVPQDFDSQTLAVLRGRLVRFLMRSREITIGRKAAGNVVDVDLSLEGPAWKVSRRQGIIQLRNTGEFYIANEGKRAIFIDGTPILAGNKCKLVNNAVIEISCLRFIFLINEEMIQNLKLEQPSVNPDT